MENRNSTFQYFGGSAVEPLEWVIESPSGTIPRAGGAELRMDPMGIFGLAVAAVMICLMLVAGVRSYEASQVNAAARQQVYELLQEQSELRAVYEEGFDPDEIRQEALAMGMIPMEEARTVPIPAPAVHEELTFGKWLGELFTDLFA